MPQWSTNLILINSGFPHACLGLDVSPGAFIVPWLEWCAIRDMESSVTLASVEPSFILVLIFGPTDQRCQSYSLSVRSDRQSYSLSVRSQRGLSLPHLRLAGHLGSGPHQLWAAWGSMWIPSRLSCHPGSSGGILQTLPWWGWRQGLCEFDQGQLSRHNLLPFPSQALTDHLGFLPKEI